MPDSNGAQTEHDAISILAIIVLYKMHPDESPAFKTLMSSICALGQEKKCVQVMLWDNTPDPGSPGPLPADVYYEAAQENAGLAAAYNRALDVAQEMGAAWLLLLDQDATLPAEFLLSIKKLAMRWKHDDSVAAIAPQLRNGTTYLSPLFVGLFRNTALPAGFMGFCGREIYALNSGSLFRIAAIRAIGGFSEDFWLDQLDMWVHHQLHRANKRIFVAGNIQVQHKLSLTDYGSLTPERYQEFLTAESAYFDLFRGYIDNVTLTATLLFRYWKQRVRGDSRAICNKTYGAFAKRVSCSRGSRVSQWNMAARKRYAHYNQSVRPRVSVCMAACNGDQYITAQLESILGQLEADDEVIVVDDASRDETKEKVRALMDPRIRLIEHSRNVGVLHTFEDAIRSASGDILFLSDHDDLWDTDRVSVMLQAFQSHPEVDIVASDAALIDENNASIGPSYYARRGKFRSGLLANVLRCSYLGCTMAFRSRIRARILPFPAGTDVLHDVWIGTANSLAGGKTLYIDHPLVFYRRHGSNATGNQRLPVARRVRIRWALCKSLASMWLNSYCVREK